jgi:hypothetical protein
MADVREVLWRQVTDADFVCVERPKGLVGGGGQTYFSLSFGRHLDKEDFGRFLALDPPSLIATEKPAVEVEAFVLTDPAEAETIEFSPRYQNDSDDRYRIAKQNRQRPTQTRHPAWIAARGFPEAPDDIADKADPRMPDLSQLKLVVVRDATGTYYADYVNAEGPPLGVPPSLNVLFEPNRDIGADGLITLEDGDLSIEGLAEILRRSREHPRGVAPSSPEIEDARDSTARFSGARSRMGQGFRQSAEERTAIDRHAMEVATRHLESLNWAVEDRSIDHPYDLYCERDGDELHVEVKGTTSDGMGVLLTPNEVAHARSNFPEVALLVVFAILLSTDDDGDAVAEEGEIDLVVPWDIDAHGSLKPTGFSYERY